MATNDTCPELLLMTTKIQSLKLKFIQPVSFSYDLVPINKQQFQRISLDLSQSMRQKNASQKDLPAHDEIILGLIEGKQANQNIKQVVENVIGEIDQNAFKSYLEEKTQIKNYAANTKDKKYCIRQIKKLQQIQKYFDTNQIKKKRKANNLFKTYIKALKRFIDMFDKIQKQNEESIMKVYSAYNDYFKQQNKYQAFLKSLEPVNIIAKQLIINEPLILNDGQVKSQQHKIIEQKQINQKQLDEQKPGQMQKTPKKGKKKIGKAQKKTKIGQVFQNAQKQIGSQQKQQDKKQEKQQKDKDKVKTVNKKKDKVNPIIKTNQTLDLFIKKQMPQNQKTIKKKNQPQNEVSPQEGAINDEYTFNPANRIVNKNSSTCLQNGQEQVKTTTQDLSQKKRLSFINYLNEDIIQEKTPIEMLRNQLKDLKMQSQKQSSFQKYYANLVLLLSTIEYSDYLMKEQKELDFSNPFVKIHEVFYFQDESQQFQGESANDSNTFTEQILDEEEQDSSLKGIKIFDDDHLSSEEISEVDSDAADIKVQYGKGAEWAITSLGQNWPKVQNFVMIALFENQLPLKITQESEPFEALSPNIWQKIYQQTHGFYGPKQNLVKNISLFAEKVSKNWIDNTLKQRTQKVGVQRFIKKQFIDELKQKIPDLQQKLNLIKNVRQKELFSMRQEKNQQKMQQRNQKLQKDILQSTGSKYIVDLLKDLKQKGHKQLRKKQLEEFINQRKGQQWELIKAQMNTMSKPVNKILLKQAQQMKPLFDYNIVQMIPEAFVQSEKLQPNEQNKGLIVIESDKSSQMKNDTKEKIIEDVVVVVQQKTKKKQSKRQAPKLLKGKVQRKSVSNKENKKKMQNIVNIVNIEEPMDLE